MFVPINILHLSFLGRDLPPNNDDHEFIITEDLNADMDEWFVKLSNLEIEQNEKFSYKVFWPHILQWQTTSRGKLVIYVQLYTQLEAYIEKHNITKIVTHGLATGYQHVVNDLGNDCEIDVTRNEADMGSSIVLRKVLTSFSVIALFFDQLYALIKKSIIPSNSEKEVDLLAFPYPDRYESILPILAKLNQPINVVVTPLTISWRLLNPVSNWPDEIQADTLTEFIDIQTFKDQVRYLISLQYNMITNNLEISDKIDEKLRDRYEIHMSQTVSYVCQKTLRKDIRIILSLYLIDNIIESTKPESVITGGMTPRDRYTLLTSDKKNAKLHYIPHSIVYRYGVIPPLVTTNYFVAGQADKRLLKEMYLDSRLPNIKPMGRPFLDSLYYKKEKSSIDSTNTCVILGTQPFDDWIRERFVNDVLDTLEQIDYQNDIIIKLHPSESVEFYIDIINKSEWDQDIRIETGNLKDYMTQSTTLITVNSNVGIEAIILGACCISYLPCEPFVSTSSYIDGTTVPCATTPSELGRYLVGTISEPKAIQEEQFNYILDSYAIGQSVEQISEFIRTN